ncbi:MarR family winged helix-turn-helix transcriptional regulator [Mycolicibacterium neworleansense]|uniref:MarR family transcriptional regulator n=1 Tax=Mycolicibacterium neworleansense TaxID=146018 RepID=A0A0H5RNS7_9MYCO|nr:MarR family winged helix-turn-helix transcriptional regulator [Mycolicibacterium neworleansense]MCV7364997.1 winged helix-turn-helix transcriptional regulator [Mycolicibacterium neworleansense]CRZ15800.1 MarR family transcriptional regulator [Mycolicibacterium neworleansense]
MLAFGLQEEPLPQEPQDLSDDEWRSWKRFGESAELLYREINAALTAQYDLSVPDVHLLNLLSTGSPRWIRMGVLAEALVLAPSRLTWQVRRLEERGLVCRSRSRVDGRGVVVGITRRGRDCLVPVLRTYAVLVRRHYLAPLSRDQMTALGAYGRRIGDGLRNHCRWEPSES